ncbi:MULTISPECIES: rhomboid-like protein [unclassified Streptomyces]|uniref:rhomboid-like protein n=1 Tax=unclassified Streptomyces TaxID=2593676 RepID=UPI001F04996C|nr:MULTISPECIES: rhomboid-like protein [unclassified Streptomyces]
MARIAPADAPVPGGDSGTAPDTDPGARPRPAAAPDPGTSGRAPLPDPAGLLDAIPAQRRPVPAPSAPSADGAVPAAVPDGVPAVPGEVPDRAWPQARRRHLRRLLPGRAATPFSLGYAAVLAVTSLVARYGDPALVHALHRASSTDVAHLLHAPATVLAASALWVADGILSPYAVLFLLVLSTLERRIGALRTAGVFLAGHVLATLATEIPVGLAVLAGHLPGSSLHRLDYGVSFGVAATVGALAGLLGPWLSRLLLALFGGVAAMGLWTLADPVTDWGHLISLVIGVACRPLVRRWAKAPLTATAPGGAPAPAGRRR